MADVNENPGALTEQQDNSQAAESTGGPSKEDNQGELILGKFKSHDDVADAYRNAEKKVSELSEYKRRYEEMIQQQQYQARMAQQQQQQQPRPPAAAQEEYLTDEEKILAQMRQELTELKQNNSVQQMLNIERDFFAQPDNADVNNDFSKVAMRGALSILQQQKPWMRYDQMLGESANMVREGLTSIVGRKVKETSETRKSIKDQETFTGGARQQPGQDSMTEADANKETVAARMRSIAQMRGGL